MELTEKQKKDFYRIHSEIMGLDEQIQTLNNLKGQFESKILQALTPHSIGDIIPYSVNKNGMSYMKINRFRLTLPPIFVPDQISLTICGTIMTKSKLTGKWVSCGKNYTLSQFEQEELKRRIENVK